VTGGLLLPSFFTRCSPADPGPEVNYAGTVAVIGAGAAGLYVADILRSKGIKVEVYEASTQLGGRVKSLRNQSVDSYPNINLMSSDFPLELGAQTFLGTNSILGKIIQTYQLATTEFPASGNHFVLDNQAKSEADWGGDPDFNAAMSFRNNLPAMAGSGQSVQQAAMGAGVATRALDMLNGQIGNAYGTDNEAAGVGELGEEEALRIGDSKILALRGNPMQELLISRFSGVAPNIRYGTAINSIDYSSDPIMMTAEGGGSFQADKVIVTVPLSIIKTNGISFSPGLPGEFTSSLAKIGMGASLRAIIEFKKNFWGDTVGFILGSSNVPEYLSFGVTRSEFNSTLSVTINGAKAEAYSSLGDGVIDNILADIDFLYAGQGTEFVRRIVVEGVETDPIFVREDWTTRPYILGGYSYPLPGATNEDRKAIGAPISKKLFFAGEATDITGNAGMVNGALASAERCAQEVVQSILEPA